MRRRIWILLTLAALALATVGIMSVAGADEALADGSYSLTVPGVGDIEFTVTGGTVAVTTAPAGFELVASESDDGEFSLASDAMTIEVEVEDGTIASEVKVDLGELSEGAHEVTIGDYTFTITVEADGSLSMDQPDGFALQMDDEGLKLTAADGSIVIELKGEDGTFGATISAPEADDELADTESDDELSDTESDDELSDHESDQKSDDQKTDDHEADSDSEAGDD